MTESEDEIQRKWIAEEVKKQMGPLNKSVEDVKGQNAQQSNLLTMQVQRIEKVDRWTKQLWSNGSGGPPGYLEIARAEDEKRYDDLFKLVSELRADAFREEGKKELIGEQEEEKDRRLGRWKTYAYIAASFGGAWFWTLVRPLVHAVIEYLAKAVR